MVREKLLIVFIFILKAGAITATGTLASKVTTLGATMASTVFGALGGAKLISYYLVFLTFTIIIIVLIIRPNQEL